jgi:Ion transport protein
MIEKITISLNDIASFSVLLFLFLFTFTLLGLELFSNRVKFDENGMVDLINGKSLRPNFDDFVQGFVMIFMVLIGDNWPQYMFRHMIALGSASCIFFVILQIFGKYVLLNLFLAILLENFEEIEISEAQNT